MLSVSKLLGLPASEGPVKTEKASRTEEIRYSRPLQPGQPGAPSGPTGFPVTLPPPVVVWNMTRRCDLHCVHCYSDSEEKDYPGELTTDQGRRLISDLADFKVPALIFSGGDPLLRADFFELAEEAAKKGIRPILSTSGVNIDTDTAKEIKSSGIKYVGISLDGGREVNDRLRGSKGAFDRAVRGLRLCREEGLTIGVRFTMTKKTVSELPAIFEFLKTEDVPRGYFAHLVYAGRGRRFAREDLDHAETRQAVDLIFDKAQELIKEGASKDIVTGSSDVDGVYLYLRLSRSDPERAEAVRKLLGARGGNTSGKVLANIDNIGDVHPDQFWTHYTVGGAGGGNVKDRPFGEIWTDDSDPVLKALRGDRRAVIKGRCARCPHFELCGGNYRVRAEFTTGDPWAEDPACYLTDEELGMERGPSSEDDRENIREKRGEALG